MRKPALVITASCVLASLLFFLAPVFRQAFRISLMQWDRVIHVQSTVWDRQIDGSVLESLAQKAEQNHDGEGLAFAALHTNNPGVSARLANEAVQRDAKLTWVYAMTRTGYPPRPETNHWLADLEKFDPQNALPHLMAAQKIGMKVVFNKQFPRGQEEENPGWRDEMAAAFESPKLDNYFDRRRQLDRRVIARYGIDDPFQVIDEYRFGGLPSYSGWYCERFAKSRIEEGEMLEARGDRKGAFEKYSAVAAFGQLMRERSHFLRDGMLRDALAHLGALSRKDGNLAQAKFYEGLIRDTERQEEEELAALRGSYRGSAVSRWNALWVRVSGVGMLASGLLLVTCLVAVIIRGRSLRLTTLHPSTLTFAMACSGAMAALLSSVLLYIDYRPYSEIFRRFVSDGDESGMPELSTFLGNTLAPLGTGSNRYLDFYWVVFYFWFGVAVLCSLILALGVLRYLQTRPRATAA